MLPEVRAAVFDLDDTLYPYRRFLRSGFAAVARHLAAAHGLSERGVFRTLVAASRGSGRGAELQACLGAWGLDVACAPDLLAVLRGHAPALRLPRPAVRLLATLRATGWRLGVLTNGWPDVQARKAEALRMGDHVDALVFAADHGPGKPHVSGFVEVLRRLDVPRERAVFVGDDPACDIEGARQAGLVPIQFTRWRREPPSAKAHAATARWSDIPVLAARALQEGPRCHAA